MDNAFILHEIRRTARENGGVPLGWRKFQGETGIKQADWGRYWPRLNDAVREAGFAPNRMEGRYHEGELLGRYAALAQTLRRLPTNGDLRYKARTAPGFPSDKTFARLGQKAALVRRLLDFCRRQPGYEDVVRMCEEYAPRLQTSSEKAGREMKIGFVYLIKSGRYYKIGKTNAVGRREYELGIQSPEPLKKIHEIRTDDPDGIEAYWHKRFEAKRKHHEWFDLTAADVAAFKRRKSM